MPGIVLWYWRMGEFQNVDQPRVVALLDRAIAEGYFIINVFAPTSTPSAFVVEHLRANHNAVVFASTPAYPEREKINVVTRYRARDKLFQGIRYVLLSSYPLRIASARIPIFRDRTTHPLQTGACMLLDDPLEALHMQLKMALLSLSKGEKRENEFRDEIQVLKDKGIVGEHARLLLSKPELTRALAGVSRK